MPKNKNGSTRQQVLLQRILASASFHRSTRSRQLLEYLAEHHFQDTGVLLHEVDIGKSLFERGDDFDPALDSIVRSSMRQLRARLTDYYEGDGRDEEIELQIPKGEYRLCFAERCESGSLPAHDPQGLTPSHIDCDPSAQPPQVGNTLAGSSPSTVASASAGPTQSAPQRQWFYYSLVAGIVLAAFLLGRLSYPASTAPPTAMATQVIASQGSLLEKFLEDTSGRIEFVPSDSVLNLIRDYTGGIITFEDYRSRRIFSPDHEAARRDPRYWNSLVRRELLNIGDATIVLRAAQNFPGHASRFGFRQSRDLRARDLRDGNFIFLGSHGANPWTRTFTNFMNFRFCYASDDSPSRWVNQHPREGEESQYPPLDPAGESRETQSYAHVAVVSNLSDNGKVMLVAGLGQPDTEAAGEFVLAPHSAETMATAMGVNRLSDIPFFEVILKTEKVGNTWRVAEVVAHRIHDSAISYNSGPRAVASIR